MNKKEIIKKVRKKMRDDYKDEQMGLSTSYFDEIIIFVCDLVKREKNENIREII